MKAIPLIIKSLSIVIAIGASLFSCSLVADTYQDENSLDYYSGNIDSPAGTDISSWGADLKGMHYFQQVETDGKPLAEAAYLQRASGVTLKLSQNVQTTTNSYQDSSAKMQNANLGVDIYIPHALLLLGVGTLATKNIYDARTVIGSVVRKDKLETSWDSSWTAKVGVAPLDGLLIWSEFIGDYKPKEYWNINGKYLFSLTSSMWLNIEASYIETDTDYEKSKSHKIAADYYVNNTLSVGVASALKEVSGQDDLAVNEIRVRKFVDDNISFNASYQKADDYWIALIGGAFRF